MATPAAVVEAAVALLNEAAAADGAGSGPPAGALEWPDGRGG
jgi:hypothetical protein